MAQASAADLVVAATEHAAKGDTGTSEDPWSRFYAGCEITSAVVVAGVAASVVQQLKYVTASLSGLLGGADLGILFREAVA